jgi:hypothetical protein
VAGWLCFAPDWRAAEGALRVARGLAVVVVPAALYFVLKAIAEPFSASTTPDLAHFTLLADLERLPSGLGQLGDHILRSINGLLTVAALIGTSLVLRRRLRPHARLPFEFWGCALIGVSVASQALIFSPEYAAHNETRLAVLSLIPFVCALAFALRDLDHTVDSLLRPRRAAVVLAVLAVGSLHHLYTVLGPSTASQTVALQILTAACAAGLLWTSARHARLVEA